MALNALLSVFIGPITAEAFDLPRQCNIQRTRRGSASYRKLKEAHLNLRHALYICMSGKEKPKQSTGKGFIVTCSNREEEEEWTDVVGSGLWWARVSPEG